MVAVSQPDGSTAVACEDAPKTAVHLVVTPNLTVPSESLRTVPLDQLIEQPPDIFEVATPEDYTRLDLEESLKRLAQPSP